MRLFFDVNGTLIGDRGQLRPLVHQVFRSLRADGHQIYLWSGMGLRWEEVRRHALQPYVLDCYRKPLEHTDGRWEAAHTDEPCLVIDDIAPIVEEYGGIVVRPYYWENDDDCEMERVYRIIRDVAATGSSSDPAFRPGRRSSS